MIEQLDLAQAPSLEFREVVRSEDEGVFVVDDQRVVAGKILDEDHPALDDGNPYSWNMCKVCRHGVIPANQLGNRDARHLPYAAGVDSVMRWIDGRRAI